MNIIATIDYIADKAKSNDLVFSAYKGSPYDFWNSSLVKYGSFCIDIESINRDVLNTYNFVAYYGDRLTQDKSNLYEVYTDTERVLISVINSLEEIGTVDTPYTIELFEQQFNDYLAGGYVRFSLTIQSDLGDCVMENF